MKPAFGNSLRPWPLLWCFLGLLFAVVALIPSNGPTPGSEYHLDKVAHLLIFMVLAAIPLARFDERRLAIICAGLVPVFGVVLEYLQKDIGGRQFSAEDMIANNLGVLLGLVIGAAFRLRRRVHRQRGEKT